MRKQDYATLARIVRAMRDDARQTIAHGEPDACLVAAARHQAATDLARDFARATAVDTHAFLMACGID